MESLSIHTETGEEDDPNVGELQRNKGGDSLSPTTPNTLGPSFDLDSSPPAAAQPALTPKKTPVKAFLNRLLSPNGHQTPPPKMLADLFNDNDEAPSPPSFSGVPVDMTMDNVEKRFVVIFGRVRWGVLKRTLSREGYEKLAYAVGKNLDKEIRANEEKKNWSKIFMSLQDVSTNIGERFHAIYRSDGDKFHAHPEGKEKGWHFVFLQEHLPEFVDHEKFKSYTIFDDPDHPNLEFFDREQLWGNCHLHGPILLQWYLTLWGNRGLNANNVQIIELSKYVRNTCSPNVLYEYIVKDSGDYSTDHAENIMPELFAYKTANYSSIEEVMTFEELEEMLKTRGPALTELECLHKTFQEKIKAKQYVFEGEPSGPKEDNGHGMILVGLYEKKVGEKKQVYLLMQNWWKGSPFVSIRLDYFLASKGKIVFSNGKEIRPLTASAHTKLTESIRCSVSSPHMEKGMAKGPGLK